MALSTIIFVAPAFNLGPRSLNVCRAGGPGQALLFLTQFKQVRAFEVWEVDSQASSRMSSVGNSPSFQCHETVNHTAFFRMVSYDSGVG